MGKAYGILRKSGDSTPPTTPENLYGFALTAVSTQLAWDASTDIVGVAGYQVWRNGSALQNTTSTTFTDSGLSPSTSYTYKVAAYDAAGNVSAFSNEVTVTTESNAAPVWSVGTQALTTGVGYGLNLTTVCSDADGDVLTFSQVSGTLPTGLTFSAAGKSISGTPSAVGNSTVTFRASDGITTTDQAIVFEVLNADTTAPSVPTNLAANGSGGELIALTWTASSDTVVANARTSGLAGYKVYRDGSLRATLGVVTSYNDPGVAGGVSYSYRLSAFDVAGNESAQTAAVAASTPAFGWTIPDTPYAIPSSGWSTGSAPVEGAGATYSLAQHVNTAGQTAVYSITSGGATGISVDSSSGLLTVGPTAASDSYAVQVGVSDGIAAPVTRTFSFAVQSAATGVSWQSGYGGSGTVADGASLTITKTGGGFGSVGPVVDVYDDFRNGTVGQSAPLTASLVGAWDVSAARIDNAQAHSGSQSILVTDGADSSRTVQAAFGSQTQLFFAFWFRSNIPSSDLDWDSGQGKLTWLMDGNDGNNFPSAFDICLPTRRAGGSNWSMAGNDGIWQSGYTASTPANEWLRWSFYCDGRDNANGFVRARTIGATTGNREYSKVLTDFYLNSASSSFDRVKFAPFIKITTNSAWYDDIYVAVGEGAARRFEIGNAATYSTCTELSICEPTAWGDASVTINVRQGAHASLAGKYLYWLDETDAATLVGQFT